MADYEDLELKESKISGKGVFATRCFQPGEVVIKWDISQRISAKNFETLSEAERQKTIPLDSGDFILMQPPASFVNHSCSPNTEVRDFSDIAVRVIEEGEEVTSDYSGYSSVSFKCNCGQASCRTRISCISDKK